VACLFESPAWGSRAALTRPVNEQIVAKTGALYTFKSLTVMFLLRPGNDAGKAVNTTDTKSRFGHESRNHGILSDF
jgi:hypothetical protein